MCQPIGLVFLLFSFILRKHGPRVPGDFLPRWVIKQEQPVSHWGSEGRGLTAAPGRTGGVSTAPVI